MARPKTRVEPWITIAVRVEPSLHRAMSEALSDPLYLRIPPGKIQEFINSAIRHELERRGHSCDTQSLNSLSPTGAPLTVDF